MASHNVVICRQDIIDYHRLSFIKVPPVIDYEMFTDHYEVTTSEHVTIIRIQNRY